MTVRELMCVCFVLILCMTVRRVVLVCFVLIILCMRVRVIMLVCFVLILCMRVRELTHVCLVLNHCHSVMNHSGKPIYLYTPPSKGIKILGKFLRLGQRQWKILN